ncbi:MAG TPA: helix-turn-helix transcriptional regulator [Candidatus Saccharimonadales bacterium]|nr:helix-turn-helix transcriptional regulator [Candidatus Saccharimonadales bacterium]
MATIGSGFGSVRTKNSTAISPSDLADKLGVSRQTVNAIETEKYDPSLPLAFKAARLFKIPIEEIFEMDGD